MSPELLSPYVLLLQVVQSMMRGGDSAAGYYDDEGNYVGASTGGMEALYCWALLSVWFWSLTLLLSLFLLSLA